MNQNIRYETRGTIALACSHDAEREQNIIDYDLARRSYEARRRLAARQAKQRAQAGIQDANLAVAPMRHRNLQRIVEESYTPSQDTVEGLGSLVRGACDAIASHPFVTQLKEGTLKGKPIPGLSYRQVFSSGVVTIMLSSVIIFLGA